MVRPFRETFPDAAAFEAAWRPDRPRTAPPADLAARVEAMLRPSGFRLFQNGGLPRLDRRRANLREEIVFAPGPLESGGFAVRFHLNHEGLGEVRARFWRPATRAPQTVASGDIGLLESPPVRSIWRAESSTEVAEAIRERIVEDLFPWLDAFDDPTTLQETLMAGSLPLVDPSTALELLLAEFGPREARRYLRTRFDPPIELGPPVQNQGFDLTTNRLPAIVGYYRL